VLAALAILAVVAFRREPSGKLAVTQILLAAGGLVGGLVSLGLTPSHFGMARNVMEQPSDEFSVGVLTGIGAAAAYATLLIVAERHRRRSTIGSRIN
jgi:hypothetical protein